MHKWVQSKVKDLFQCGECGLYRYLISKQAKFKPSFTVDTLTVATRYPNGLAYVYAASYSVRLTKNRVSFLSFSYVHLRCRGKNNA